MISSFTHRFVRLRRAWWLVAACSVGAGCSVAAGCSSDEGGGQPAPSGSAAGSGASPGGGGQPGAAGASAGGTVASAGVANSGAAGVSANAGSGGVAPNPGFDAKLLATALAANQSVGIEWNAVEGASAYKVYFAEGTAPTAASPSSEVKAPGASFVHRALTNGTAYHYAVSAIVGGQESMRSNEVVATPTGEWVLEELGDGQFQDLATGKSVPRVPIEKRVHVLLFAEGYTAADLAKFHAASDHTGERNGDVDGWVDYVFGLAPYQHFREAFVVWFLARPSAGHFDGGDTAFMVPVSGSATGGVTATGETATRVWQAIATLPVPPSDFTGTGFGNARTHVASFLMYDAQRGRAGISGLALALRNPAQSSQRIASAFGVGHAHEFTHAFASLRDEYIELDNQAPNNAPETSNVVGSNQCSQLPWQHLLSGGQYNADTVDLVGAFGTAEQGYHSELICLMNGTHDNAAHYGGSGLLRDDDRMCNFCREIAAYRIYSRSGIVADDAAGFSSWKTTYRAKFYERFPFVVPPVVPQTNNVQNPAQGMARYEACLAERQLPPASLRVRAAPSRQGCIVEQ